MIANAGNQVTLVLEADKPEFWKVKLAYKPVCPSVGRLNFQKWRVFIPIGELALKAMLWSYIQYIRFLAYSLMLSSEDIKNINIMNEMYAQNLRNPQEIINAKIYGI